MRNRRGLVVHLALLLVAGCATEPPLWEDQPALPSEVVESLLGLGEASVFDRDLVPSEIPVVPVKARTRPCCAFGYALKPELGFVPIPGVVLQNVTSIAALGAHRYDSGVLPRQNDADQAGAGERNGLIYTCRGGFIDTAHVRDNADWTMFLAPTLARRLETGGVMALPDEGGGRAVVLAPVPTVWIESFGRRRLAVAMAEWLAFQLSIWHEVATWYGWSAVPMFSERASAFSPEDLYSNALGARLAGSVIGVRAATTDRTYDRTLDRWTRTALELLGAVDAEAGMAAADQVDGLWWDSTRRVPDVALVRQRNFDLATPVLPWTIGRSGRPGAKTWEHEHCGAGSAPAPIQIADGLGELHFAELVRLEIRPEASIAARIAPGGGPLTQADLPRIVAGIREEAFLEFGTDAELRDE